MLRRERLCEAARERRPVLGLARCARLQHPRADEEVNHLVLPRHRGERQWLFTVHRTLANRRTVLHEPSDHREMATVSRRVQRCPPVVRDRSGAGASIDHPSDHVQMAAVGCGMQRLPAVVRGSLQAHLKDAAGGRTYKEAQRHGTEDACRAAPPGSVRAAPTATCTPRGAR